MIEETTNLFCPWIILPGMSNLPGTGWNLSVTNISLSDQDFYRIGVRRE